MQGKLRQRVLLGPSISSESQLDMACSKHFVTAFTREHSAPVMTASSTTLTGQQTSIWFLRPALRDMMEGFCIVSLQNPITYLLSIHSTKIIKMLLPTYSYFNLSLLAIGSLTHCEYKHRVRACKILLHFLV